MATTPRPSTRTVRIFLSSTFRDFAEERDLLVQRVFTAPLELASPSALARNGWTSRTLKVGDTVTVTGYAAKVAMYRGDARSVVLADGRSLFGGASDDQRPDSAQ